MKFTLVIDGRTRSAPFPVEYEEGVQARLAAEDIFKAANAAAPGSIYSINLYRNNNDPDNDGLIDVFSNGKWSSGAKRPAEDDKEWKASDIVYARWGYGIIIVNFCRVVGLTKSGKSAQLQPLETDRVFSDGSNQGPYKATPGKASGEVITRRLKKSYDGDFIATDESKRYRKWNGKPIHGDNLD